MGIKRVVDTDFWYDDKVLEVFSPEDKLFMLYLLSNPHTTQLGIYKITKKSMAFEIGYSPEAISVLIDRFQNSYRLIRYSERTKEVAIKNYLRHSIIKGGKPVEDLLRKEIIAVKDKSLLQFVYDEISGCDNLNETVKKVLDSLNVNDIQNENDNDNDNDVSYHDSCHDSSPNRQKPTRHKYGMYNNVLLSDEDYQKLQEEFPHDYTERINRLSEYIESTGKKYKSHLATIRAWSRKEKPTKEKSSNPFLDMLRNGD